MYRTYHIYSNKHPRMLQLKSRIIMIWRHSSLICLSKFEIIVLKLILMALNGHLFHLKIVREHLLERAFIRINTVYGSPQFGPELLFEARK